MQDSGRTLKIMAELFGGWFGFLGVGHLLMGDVATGIVLMLGWWFAILVFIGAAIGTLGTALFCIVPIWFIIPIVSAFILGTRRHTAAPPS
jgi:hypothetical protein